MSVTHPKADIAGHHSSSGSSTNPVDHLAVLRDRHINAESALGIDHLIACGIVSGHSPP
jgi:hypothetical protein